MAHTIVIFVLEHVVIRVVQHVLSIVQGHVNQHVRAPVVKSRYEKHKIAFNALAGRHGEKYHIYRHERLPVGV